MVKVLPYEHLVSVRGDCLVQPRSIDEYLAKGTRRLVSIGEHPAISVVLENR